MKKLLLLGLCFLSFQANGRTIDTIEVVFQHGVNKLKELSDSVPNFIDTFGKGRFWKLNVSIWKKFGSEANGSNFELLEKISKIQTAKEDCSILIGFVFAAIGATIGYKIGKYYDDLEKAKTSDATDKNENHTEYAENGMSIGAAISLIPSFILGAYLTQLPNSLADFQTA